VFRPAAFLRPQVIAHAIPRIPLSWPNLPLRPMISRSWGCPPPSPPTSFWSRRFSTPLSISGFFLFSTTCTPPQVLPQELNGLFGFFFPSGSRGCAIFLVLLPVEPGRRDLVDVMESTSLVFSSSEFETVLSKPFPSQSLLAHDAFLYASHLLSEDCRSADPGPGPITLGISFRRSPLLFFMSDALGRPVSELCVSSAHLLQSLWCVPLPSAPRPLLFQFP